LQLAQRDAALKACQSRGSASRLRLGCGAVCCSRRLLLSFALLAIRDTTMADHQMLAQTRQAPTSLGALLVRDNYRQPPSAALQPSTLEEVRCRVGHDCCAG